MGTSLLATNRRLSRGDVDIMRKVLSSLLLASFLMVGISHPAFADGWRSTVDNLIATPMALVGVVALIAGAIGLYFLPSVVGITKQKENVVAICVLNFFLGWTVIGWLVSLLWALTNNGCKKFNKDVAPSVFGAYIAIFLLCFIPLWIGGTFYERAKQDKADEEAKELEAKRAAELAQQRTQQPVTQMHINPGAVYQSQYSAEDRANYPGIATAMEFNQDGKTFHYYSPSSGTSLADEVGKIGFVGGYEIDGNQMKTWDLELPNKIDQIFTVEPDRIIRKSDGIVFLLTQNGTPFTASTSTTTNAGSGSSIGSSWGGSTSNWSGGSTSSGSGSTTQTDPAIIALQQQNRTLLDQIKALQQNSRSAQADIQSLKQQLNDTKQVVADRDRDISKLENNLRIADENSQSKDRTVEEMRKTLERWKIGNTADGGSSLAGEPNTDVAYNQGYAQSLSLGEFEEYLKRFPVRYAAFQRLKARAEANPRIPIPDAWTNLQL